MKILFVSECYPTEEKPQYCIFLEQEAKALKGLGHDVSVLMPQRYKTEGLSSKTRNGIKVIELNYRMNFLQKTSVITVQCPILRRFMESEKFDIVAVHLVSFALVSTIEKFCHLTGSKLVIHFHGLNIWRDYYPTHRVYQEYILPKKRFLYNKADAVICVSKSVEKVFRQRNRKTPSFVVYNGVDIDKFSPSNGKKNAIFTVLCVANLIPIKGQKYLIEAMSELQKAGKQVKLQLIGDGPDRQKLMDQASSLGISNAIVFMGVQPYEVVSRYMAEADMFILPSYFDACPCVCFEAMASGALTCAANIYGPTEIITHMETGMLFQPQNAKSIADTVAFAMDHPDKVQKIVEQGRAFSKRNTWNDSAKTLDQAYCKVMLSHTNL